jgi:hypothetical protein
MLNMKRFVYQCLATKNAEAFDGIGRSGQPALTKSAESIIFHVNHSTYSSSYKGAYPNAGYHNRPNAAKQPVRLQKLK